MMDNSKNTRYTKSKRVVSFSIPDSDIEAHKDYKALREHCDNTGINFSFHMTKKMRELAKELGLS